MTSTTATTVATTTPILLSERELPTYESLFLQCQIGPDAVCPKAARQLFDQASLPVGTLQQILTLANMAGDEEPLKKRQFHLVLKLIACAQNGLPISTEGDHLASTPLPLFSLPINKPAKAAEGKLAAAAGHLEETDCSRGICSVTVD